MKNLIFIICLCGFFFNASAADASVKKFGSCVPFQGKNGKNYCYSTLHGFDWFSAVAYCDAQGFTLVTVNELCDISDLPYEKYTRDINEGSCRNRVGMPNLPSNLYWTNSVSNEGGATVAKSDSYRPNYDAKEWARVPICKMPD